MGIMYCQQIQGATFPQFDVARLKRITAAAVFVDPSVARCDGDGRVDAVLTAF